MPYDGSGNFNRVRNWVADRDANIKVRADLHDSEDDNFASGLSNVITKDGQTQPTANIPLNGKKITNLGAPTNPTDAATKAYADALRNFDTAINLTGPDPQARIGFTGADIGFGAKVAGNPAGSLNRWVWNDKPDLSGTDIMQLRDSGVIDLSPSAGGGIYARSRSANVSDHTFNIGHLGAPSDVAFAGAQMGLRGHDWDGANPGGIDFYGATAAGALASMGTWDRTGNLTVVGALYSNSGSIVGSNTLALLGTRASGGAVYLRPNGIGSVTGQMVVDNAGGVNIAGGANIAGNLAVSGNVTGDSVTSATGTLVSRPTGTANAHVIFQNNVGGTTGYVYFNNATNTLNLQNQTGSAGVLQILNTAELRYNNNLVTKPTAGQWTATSDARIKNVVGDYEVGLDAIRQIAPKIFTYKGNETFEPPGTDPLNPEAIVPLAVMEAPYSNSPHYQMALDGDEVVGLIAQEAEAVMPSLVSQQSGYIDGEPVDDLRNVDPTNLQYAMINAIKELATRVEALEAAA